MSATIAQIMAHISALKPLDDNIKIEMKIVSQKDVKSLLSAAKRHIILQYFQKRKMDI